MPSKQSTMILGSTEGALIDRLTQRWVQATGRRVNVATSPWLSAPAGDTEGIGVEFFHRYAQRNGLTVETKAGSGLFRVAELGAIAARIDERVSDFYERTADYDIDAWSEWNPAHRPFGRLLAVLFNRRLQQLNVPLSGLDTSRGMASQVLQIIDPLTREVTFTVWQRRLIATGNLIYAGSYGLIHIPGSDLKHVKVAFPLPNGSAIVIMRPEIHPDGSLSLHSIGRRFGDAGFYFTLFDRHGHCWARYVRAMQESIHVYGDGGLSRADHVLRLWGRVFLRLHYRMRPRK